MGKTELWQEAQQWLLGLNVGSTHFDSLAELPSVLDFAYHLRNGVLLCDLLNFLDPESIDMRNVYPNAGRADVLCHKNINMFLRICRRSFGLFESDLFDPPMLYNYTDFYKVLRTLEKLSNCQKVRQRNIRGFGKTTVRVKNDKDDDTYAIISKTTSQEDYSRWIKDQNSRKDPSDRIYKNVMGKKAEENKKAVDKRKFHTDELINTEKRYVEILEKFVTLANTYVYNDVDRNQLFPGLLDLHRLHKEFLERLEYLDSTNGRLSLAFLEKIDEFYAYKEYFCNLATAEILMTEKKSRDRQFCEGAKNLERDMDVYQISDAFKFPFQRLLKYHLLIQAILNCTCEDHPDYQSLCEAVERVKEMGSCMDIMKYQRDTYDVIDSVKKSISDWHMTEEIPPEEYGGLYVSSHLRVFTYETNKTELMYVFLFDKVLLFCSPLSKKADLFYKKLELLMNTEMEDIKGDPNGWRLKGKEENKYAMHASEAKVAADWKRQLRHVLPRNNVKSHHSLQLHTFPGLTRCTTCNKMLQGLYYQGYHCTGCYGNFHENCYQKSKSCTEIQKRLSIVEAANGYESNRISHLSIRRKQRIIVDVEKSRGKPFVKVSTLDGREGFVDWSCIGQKPLKAASKAQKTADDEDEMCAIQRQQHRILRGIQSNPKPKPPPTPPREPSPKPTRTAACPSPQFGNHPMPDTFSKSPYTANDETSAPQLHQLGVLREIRTNPKSKLSLTSTREPLPKATLTATQQFGNNSLSNPFLKEHRSMERNIGHHPISKGAQLKPKRQNESLLDQENPPIPNAIMKPQQSSPNLFNKKMPTLPNIKPPLPPHYPLVPRRQFPIPTEVTDHPHHPSSFQMSNPFSNSQAPIGQYIDLSQISREGSIIVRQDDQHPSGSSRPHLTKKGAGFQQTDSNAYLQVIDPQNSEAASTPISNDSEASPQVRGFPWRFGKMARKEAEARLRSTPIGTFLVRFSEAEQTEVLSVKIEGRCSHMKISTENNEVKLSNERVFSTLEELVEHYKTTSLEESIDDVDVTLQTPISDIQFYRAKTVHSGLEDVLEIRKGDIIVLHEEHPFQGENDGWWLGRLEEQIGYFHESWVEELSAENIFPP